MHTLPDDARPRLTGGVRLQIDNATGNGVLLYPEGIVELNETAREILARCDGRTLGRIIAELAQEYDVDPNELANDIRSTLIDFAGRKLIQFT